MAAAKAIQNMPYMITLCLLGCHPDVHARSLKCRDEPSGHVSRYPLGQGALDRRALVRGCRGAGALCPTNSSQLGTLPE